MQIPTDKKPQNDMQNIITTLTHFIASLEQEAQANEQRIKELESENQTLRDQLKYPTLRPPYTSP